ncbi:MAG: MerR family transcriptional regulator [Bacteroidales bacterium]|nr:MerR family transcriptional regulator [Bacteroidales bacterium]
MEDEKTNKKEKLFYSIGELADMLGEQTSAVRYWEKEFDIIKPQKNKKGNRMFTPHDVENMKLIHYLLKEKGMTIAGAKRKMSDNPDDIRKNHEVIRSLQGIKEMLVKIRDGI